MIQLMRIGELARLTGASTRALRYYEEQGLLFSSRTPSGYRVYAESDVDRVAYIRMLFAAGLRGSCIAVMLEHICVSRKMPYAERDPVLLGQLEPARDRLRQEIAERTASLAILERVIEAVDRADGTPPFPRDQKPRPRPAGAVCVDH